MQEKSLHTATKDTAQSKKINKINKVLGEGWISKAQSFKRTGWKNGGRFALGQGFPGLRW